MPDPFSARERPYDWSSIAQRDWHQPDSTPLKDWAEFYRRAADGPYGRSPLADRLHEMRRSAQARELLDTVAAMTPAELAELRSILLAAGPVLPGPAGSFLWFPSPDGGFLRPAHSPPGRGDG